MPRRAYRCVVDFTLNEVSAPGVWLPSREDVYLSVSLFGQYQTTQFLPPVFPLLVNEKFRFEKTYYSALDYSQVAEYLNDELMIFELVQLSDYMDGAVRLASFSSTAGDFLRPFPFHAPTYSPTSHEILLSRTIAFPGISPKIEFSTKTLVKQSISPELDALEDALEEEKERRVFKKTHRTPTRRARSAKVASSPRRDVSFLSYIPGEDDPPPRYRQPTKSFLSRCRSLSVPSIIADVDLLDTTDSRPAFVIRKMDPELTGRVPGSVLGNRNTNATRKDKNKEGKKESKSKSKSKKDKEKKQKRSSSKSSGDLDLECSSFQQSKHTDKMIRDSGRRPPVYLHFDDDEEESIYIARRRPRSRSASMRSRPRYRLRTPPPLYPFHADPICERLDHVSVCLDHPHDRIRLLPCYEPSVYDPDRHFVPIY